MGKVAIFLFFLFTFLSVFGDPDPEATGRKARQLSKSEVSIVVGETPAFLYQVRGYTYSPLRISVSGDYFNDEINRNGYANLFLGVQPYVDYYEFWPNGNQLLVNVVNRYGDVFYFQVSVPDAVYVNRDLCIRQFNYTALIVQGPSRSAFYTPCFNGVAKSQRIYNKINPDFAAADPDVSEINA